MSSVAILTLVTATLAQPAAPVVSVQAWSFNRHTAFRAIELTAQAGSSAIELFPGQPMKEGSTERIGPDMSPAAITELKAHLVRNGVKPVAFGVTGVSKDAAQARKLFGWAKDMGIGVINTESEEAIDMIEQMVKEFDIKVGFHNHPQQPNNPNYRVWNPKHIAELVKNRDKRIGACADTGHWVRSGIKPVDALKTLNGRVVSSHLKDLHIFGREGHDVPFGNGKSDMAGILRSYQRMGFTGPMSVEYEHNWDANVTDVAQCVGFVRGFWR